jgi:hypothetical protein
MICEQANARDGVPPRVMAKVVLAGRRRPKHCSVKENEEATRNIADAGRHSERL